jgi:hypothetical protein
MDNDPQIELQSFIPVQHDVKIPTKKEARTARAQFLALCWSLFLLGWINGSTGPLLPSIQKSYDVSEPYLFILLTFSVPTNYNRSGSKQSLGYFFWEVRLVVFIGPWY